MQSLPTLEELVAATLTQARDGLAWNSITLGEIQGKCLKAAEDQAPDLVDELSNVAGLGALILALQACKRIIVPADEELGVWTFVREVHS
ncbi:hypothetical protein KX729_29330 [Rhizobium sp. XQZ8]|uniref:hypothetical protein n=1 Tax=Rhizobium populisoli TaxID=2859785 RepID=UPI001CA4A632|nr:hypothetical protein [Rhizobium populisoli]MBW6425520.1 hypothetical protein [Rhizobium populisoli]